MYLKPFSEQLIRALRFKILIRTSKSSDIVNTIFLIVLVFKVSILDMSNEGWL